MLKYLALASAILCALTVNAEARQRHEAGGMHPMCNVTMPCVAPYASTPEEARVARGRYVARSFGLGVAIERPVRVKKQRAAKADWRVQIRQKPYRRGKVVRVETALSEAPAASVAQAVQRAVSGIVAPLAAKVAEIQSACGSKVISAIRHTRIAGTSRMSLHATGQAVDLAGNPGCIYGLLHGWPGGYSTDYARVRHVHLSYGGPEHGIRFAHGGGRRHAHRHHRHQRRYANAT
jgi:hypothetical protein